MTEYLIPSEAYVKYISMIVLILQELMGIYTRAATVDKKTHWLRPSLGK